MNYLKIVLKFKGELKEITIDTLENLHELEIYLMLEKMFPYCINVNSNDETELQGYSFTFKGGLTTVMIYRP
jgi:hypothetical protein